MTAAAAPWAVKLGALIADFRGDAYLSQDELAARLGVTQASVSRWEHGLFLPHRYSMRALCNQAPGYAEEMQSLWKLARWELKHTGEEWQPGHGREKERSE